MKRGLIFAFGLLLIGLSMVFVDQELATYFDQPHFEELRLSARGITNFALGEYWFGLAILVFTVASLVLRFFRPASLFWETIRHWGALFFAGLLGSGLILLVLKMSFGRERPVRTLTHDQLVFHPFNTDSYFQSFPSGHSQVLFATAAAFALLRPRWAWFFYLIAAGFAFTRVMILQHFLSDIIAGGMVGYFGAVFVFEKMQQKWKRPGSRAATSARTGVWAEENR